ncbi:hypothetical protein F8280_24820 [Micromonospora noduli]|nr:peptidase inhibitor family I36 protein [Micromonospora noduli]KAB1919761.1 hypothetical protein F8280_24820 [Micromonospora noduli]
MNVPVIRDQSGDQESSTKSRRPAPAELRGPDVATDRPATVEFAAAADGPVLAGCSYKYSCLYSDNNYAGYRLSFTTCAFRDLSRYAYPTGGLWNDKVSSWSNNQTTGTLSWYYNYEGNGRWLQFLNSKAPYAAGQITGYNNMMDGIQVCPT